MQKLHLAPQQINLAPKLIPLARNLGNNIPLVALGPLLLRLASLPLLAGLELGEFTRVLLLGLLDLAVVALLGFGLLAGLGFAGAAQARFFVFALLGQFAVEFRAFFGQLLDFFLVVRGAALGSEGVEGGEGDLGGGG